jgi:predicted glycosyltransferase
MASEAAVLGVPAIFLSTSTRGYTNEQEHKYRLVYGFSEQDQALAKAQELLHRPDLCSQWQKRRIRMLDEVTDVTAHVVDVVEAYA